LPANGVTAILFSVRGFGRTGISHWRLFLPLRIAKRQFHLQNLILLLKKSVLTIFLGHFPNAIQFFVHRLIPGIPSVALFIPFFLGWLG